MNRFALPVAAALAYIALSAFFAAFWPGMGFGMRLVVTLGAGMLGHMLAMMAWQSPLPQQAGNSVLLAAAPLQAAGWLVLTGRLFPQLAAGDAGIMLAMLLMAAQEYAVYRHYRVPHAAFYAMLFLYGGMLALLHALGAGPETAALTLGLSMLLLAHGLRATPLAPLTPAWYVLGGCFFYAALFRITRGSALELLYVAAAAAGYGAAIRLRSAALLFAAAAFTIAYLGYGTTAYVMRSPLWPLSLVLLAVMLFAVLALARTLRRRYLPAR